MNLFAAGLLWNSLPFIEVSAERYYPFSNTFFLLPLACVIKTESRKGRRAYFLPGS
jgi:hypothetical protein